MHDVHVLTSFVRHPAVLYLQARTSSHNGRDDNSAQERSPTSSSHAWSPLTNNDRPHSQGGESERAAASASDVKPARSSIGAGGQSAHPNSPVTPSSARNGETRSGTGADGVAENSSSSLRPESSDGREGLVSSGRRNSTDPAVKEKHAGNGDEGGRSSSGKGSSKRKKASRACFHCQKAHLTCDDCEYLVLATSGK